MNTRARKLEKATVKEIDKVAAAAVDKEAKGRILKFDLIIHFNLSVWELQSVRFV